MRYKWSPDKITMSSTSLFFTSVYTHEYCLTASAVPLNQSVEFGVCVAAKTSTNPDPPLTIPFPKLYVFAKCLFKDALLNCVKMYTLLIPQLMQLDIGTSMSRYAPPIGTAGFDRVFVNGYKREPAPPPKTMAATVFAFAIADTDCCLSVGCARASERVSFWILVLLLLLIREFGEIQKYQRETDHAMREKERA